MTGQTVSYFSEAQLVQLLKPLNPNRVERLKKAGQNLSYLAQHDVRAHLNRILGFGRWSADVVQTQQLFEEKVKGEDGKDRWYVGWQATVTMMIGAPDGTQLASYTETAVGGNTQPQRHEANDMALKSATSDAVKRCAINLGDQFGLSLYQKGSTGSLVKATLMNPYVEVVAEVPEPDPVAEAQLSHSLGVSAGPSDYS